MAKDKEANPNKINLFSSEIDWEIADYGLGPLNPNVFIGDFKNKTVLVTASDIIIYEEFKHDVLRRGNPGLGDLIKALTRDKELVNRLRKYIAKSSKSKEEKREKDLEANFRELVDL